MHAAACACAPDIIKHGCMAPIMVCTARRAYLAGHWLRVESARHTHRWTTLEIAAASGELASREPNVAEC